MKYRVEDVSEGADGSGESLGTARIGVGLRIKAVVQTTEVGLNLGSLIAIGAEVIGIDSPDVTNLIPLTSEIDQTSIQGGPAGSGIDKDEDIRGRHQAHAPCRGDPTGEGRGGPADQG